MPLDPVPKYADGWCCLDQSGLPQAMVFMLSGAAAQQGGAHSSHQAHSQLWNLHLPEGITVQPDIICMQSQHLPTSEAYPRLDYPYSELSGSPMEAAA